MTHYRCPIIFCLQCKENSGDDAPLVKCPESIALTPVEMQHGYCNTCIQWCSSGGKTHRCRGGQTFNVDPPRMYNCSRASAIGRVTGRALAQRQVKHKSAAGETHL